MSYLIERDAALEIVKRTSGDYASAFSEIARLPAVETATPSNEKTVFALTEAEKEIVDWALSAELNCAKGALKHWLGIEPKSQGEREEQTKNVEDFSERLTTIEVIQGKLGW
jgi:hypothetical protein